MSQHLPTNDTSISQATSNNTNRPEDSATTATSVKSPHGKPIHKAGNDLSLSLFPRWIRSNRVGFLAAGFAIAAWAPIIPFIKDRFALDEHGLGLLLLCVGAGSLFSSPLSGILTTRFGCKIPIFGATITWAICIALISVLNNIYLMALVLFIFGMAAVILEVVSNINGAMIEQLTGKTVMSGLHALYSLGGLTGSFGVTFILGAQAGLVAAASGAALFMLSAVLLGGRNLFNHAQLSAEEHAHASTAANATDSKPYEDTTAAQTTDDAEVSKLAAEEPNQATSSETDKSTTTSNSTEVPAEGSAGADRIAELKQTSEFKELKQQAHQLKKAVAHAQKEVPEKMLQKRYLLPPTILMVSFMLFVLYLTEGAMLDWSGVFLYEERGVSLEMAGYGYAVFAIMMTTFRFLGDRLVLRMGKRRVIVIGTLIICAGFCCSALVDHLYANLMCFALIGIGSSNVIPQLVSYVAKVNDVPMHIAVTLVNSFGFTGVLIGPALIGFVAHLITLPGAFIMLGIIVLTVTFLSNQYIRGAQPQS